MRLSNKNDNSDSDYHIKNNFNGTSTIIPVSKLMLESNFDYFASLSRYTMESSCVLNFELNPVIIKIVIDLLMNNKTIEESINLDNFIEVLQMLCALSCSNDNLYKDITAFVVVAIESEYGKQPHKDATFAINVCAKLDESMIYSQHIETIKSRLTYIIAPYKYVDRVVDTKTYFGDNGYFLVIPPERTWIKNTICRRKMFSQSITGYAVVLPVYSADNDSPSNKDVELRHVALVKHDDSPEYEIKLTFNKRSELPLKKCCKVYTKNLNEPIETFVSCGKFDLISDSIFKIQWWCYPIKSIHLREFDPSSINLVCISIVD